MILPCKKCRLKPKGYQLGAEPIMIMYCQECEIGMICGRKTLAEAKSDIVEYWNYVQSESAKGETEGTHRGQPITDGVEADNADDTTENYGVCPR